MKITNWIIRDKKGKKIGEIESNPPWTGEDILFMALVFLIMGCLIGAFILMRSIGSANFEYHVFNILTILTKWFIVAIAVGVTVFLVSIKNSAGTVIAIIEAILAACAYHVMCLMPLPGLIGNRLESFFETAPPWVGLFMPMILLLPSIVDTIFLAIGSANNLELRQGYIKMNKVFFYIAVSIITIVLLIEGAAEESILNGIALMIEIGILFSISAFICAKIEKVILQGVRRK